PEADTIRCVSCVPSRRSAASSRTPMTAPLAPEIPTTMRFFRSAMIVREVGIQWAVVAGDERVEIDRVLPRNPHAREDVRRIDDRPRGVQTHLRAHALQVRGCISG